MPESQRNSENAVDIAGSRVLVVDDTPANVDVLCQALEAAGYQVMVANSGRVALDLATRFTPRLILLDVTMPEMDGFEVCRRLKLDGATGGIPVVFLTARDDADDVVRGFRAGGVDYVLKPFRKEEVLARIRTHVEHAALVQALQEKNAALQAETERRERVTKDRNTLASRLTLVADQEAARWGLGEFVGNSPTTALIMDKVERLQAVEQTSVLIQGESGTGKELIARAIHSGSGRRDGPFVPINCGAIPRELADSLLFGHVKGAFTGADREQIGYFELADGGVLFLDEVGTLPMELQPKLLRVLEERQVLPLGARVGRPIDVRVVAATNADLQGQVQAGAFRPDLYYRLARATVDVPPLRDRREDIGLLARHFLAMFGIEMGLDDPSLSPEALALLEQHDFPGNVRELKNLIEHALIESRGQQIQAAHVSLRQPLDGPPAPAAAIPDLPLNLEEAEMILIRRALEQTDGNISAAARLLGVERTKIYRRLNQVTQG